MTILSDQLHLAPAQLEAYWMPFTANRQFKSHPRMMVKAEGMYYTTDDGRSILDGAKAIKIHGLPVATMRAPAQPCFGLAGPLFRQINDLSGAKITVLQTGYRLPDRRIRDPDGKRAGFQ